MGIHTLADGAIWRVPLEARGTLSSLLTGDVLWDSDFYVYSESSDHPVPNPFADDDLFFRWSRWTLSQSTGSGDWWVASNLEVSAFDLGEIVAEKLFARTHQKATVTLT